MMRSSFAIIFVCSFLIISCKPEKKKRAENKHNASFDQMLEDYNRGKLELNPINATYAGVSGFNDKFPNTLSDEYQLEKKSFYTKYEEKLKTFKDEDLTQSQQMSKAVLAWDCEINLEESDFKKGILMPIDQMWSVNLVMGQLASGNSAQPFKSVKDYENWLSRLEKYDIWLHWAKKRMTQGIEQGYVLPKSLIKKVIPQFKVLADTKLTEHLFYSPLKKFPSNFSAQDTEKLKIAYTKVLKDKLIPSFQSLYEFLKTDYLKAGRTSSGISSIPNGGDYYNFSIKKYTTTDMTAEQIHALGLKEVNRILSEMEKIKRQVGFKGSLKEFFNAVRKDKKLMPYTEPKQVLDHFRAIYQKMKPQLNKLFAKKPKTKFVIKQTEKFREASASAEYSQGSLDGTRPGTFYVPIPDATKYNVLSDEALFLHEAIPGHHYQISLTQENKTLPNFRKTLWYSAYGEGWALYTESLGKELGLYTDPYQHLGMLSMEMHRAVRLVVDTGIHLMGWSREKAIQYSLDNEAETKASITSEIERYMANPGQALAYKIGQLKIRELRSKAEKVLGDKFDIREFHNQILATGCIPLTLLEKKIDKWIESEK